MVVLSVSCVHAFYMIAFDDVNLKKTLISKPVRTLALVTAVLLTLSSVLRFNGANSLLRGSLLCGISCSRLAGDGYRSINH